MVYFVYGVVCCFRYNTDVATPLSSAISPKSSSCVLSPYSFDIDSPPPTAEDFNEFFNAPATYMEKDFSQLTLSGSVSQRCPTVRVRVRLTADKTI